MTERNIEIVNNELSIIFKDRDCARKELNKNFNKIKNVFEASIIKPEILTNSDSTRANLSIQFKSINSFNIVFNCLLINQGKDVEILECIEYENRIKQEKNSIKNNDIFEHFSKVANEIGKLKANLSEALIFEVLSFVRNHLIALRKFQKNIDILEGELILLRQQESVDKIKSIFVPINNFCINTFLCQQNNVEIKGESPSKSEMVEMKIKNKIKNEKFDFIVMDFNKNNFNFKHVLVDFLGKDIYVSCENKKVSGFKNINALLSKQIKYKSKLLEFKNKGFSISLPVIGSPKSTSKYGTSCLKSLSIKEFVKNQIIKTELLSININNF
jgi:hypothetical protein